MLVSILLLASVILGILFGGPKDPVEAGVLIGVFIVFFGVSGAFIFYAGSSMHRLSNYGLVLGAIVFGMATSFFTCMPLCLLGIWPLVVMLDPDVRDAFRSPHP